MKVQAVKSVEKIYEDVLKRQGLQVEDINKLAESEHTTEKDFSKVILRIFRKFNLSTILNIATLFYSCLHGNNV